MIKQLARSVLWIFGWRLGEFPLYLRKAVIVVGPHTSTWDFPVALLARITLGIKVQFVGKAELFKPPFGFLFRYWGGLPVARSVREDTVTNIAALFKLHDDFLFGISPEGSRHHVSHLRTGFYYIACTAVVPMVLIGMDFHKKTIETGPIIPPGLGERETVSMVVNYFSSVRGKNPDQGIGPEHMPK
jgi:1-acyl-sn-glycerol-3-phosphate acyltransferase